MLTIRQHQKQMRNESTFLYIDIKGTPVVKQDVRPPDLAVRKPYVGHTWIVRHVPLQVEIFPVLHTHTQCLIDKYTLSNIIRMM